MGQGHERTRMSSFVYQGRSTLLCFGFNSNRIIVLAYLAAMGLAAGTVADRTVDELRFTDLELRTQGQR